MEAALSGECGCYGERVKYEVWRKETTRGGWEHSRRDTYRWRWLARFVAWQRTKAGWTNYHAVPAGVSPYDA